MIHDDPESILSGRQPTHSKVEAAPTPSLARSAEGAGHDTASLLELQRLAGNASVRLLVARDADDEPASQRSPVLDVVGQGGGAPLGDDLRSEMEGRLGDDFSDVRVHRDATASESTKAVEANAYTVGNDVVFRSDQWAPETDQGKHTLAHELTHVMQQRAGPVAGTETGDGIRLSDPVDPFERAADRSADAAMSAQEPTAAAMQAVSPAPASAQRQGEEEEEEELQGSFVQRQGEEEEEEEELAQP